MTVKAKAVIQAFYGKAPKLSYWNGTCSTGGRQGLKEADISERLRRRHRRGARQPHGDLLVDRSRRAKGSGQRYLLANKYPMI